MEQHWFKKTGWLYLPAHPMGYLVTLLAILFMVPVTMAVVRNGHSVSDDLYSIFVFATCTLFGGNGSLKKQVFDNGHHLNTYFTNPK